MLEAEKVDSLRRFKSSSGNLVVLASHIASSTLANSLSYAIVTLSVGTTQNSVTVVSTRYVSYQAVRLCVPSHQTSTYSFRSIAA
jgi:hypothetical protein